MQRKAYYKLGTLLHLSIYLIAIKFLFSSIILLKSSQEQAHNQNESRKQEEGDG